MRPFAKDLQEFRLKLEQLPRDKRGCWIWQGTTSEGYGIVRIQGRRDRTHRFSYRAYVSEIPRGLCVLHACDNRRCCNPEHLTLGTKAQNMSEMYRRDRQSTSAQRKTFGRRKLTEKDVRKIDALYAGGMNQEKIAKRFGLHQTAIGKVLRRETWQHVPRKS